MQDWLDDEFNDVDALTQDAQLGRMWLMQMGKGADKSGITIQYCMSYWYAKMRAAVGTCSMVQLVF
jgi:hypothetical protein